jgi:hypothetical protein
VRLSRRDAPDRDDAAASAVSAALPAPADDALSRAELALERAGERTDLPEALAGIVEAAAHGASVADLAEDADVLLAGVREQYREGRFADVLRVARLAVGTLLLLQRWRDLVEVLELARAAAVHLGDGAAESWAAHNLAVLAEAAGDLPLAGALQGEAGEQATDASAHAGDGSAAPTTTHAGAGKLAVLGTPTGVMAAGVAALAVAAPVVVVNERSPLFARNADAAIVGFAATRESIRDRSPQRGSVPVAEPGATLRACGPLYLVTVLRFRDIEPGESWSAATSVDGDTFASYPDRWSASSPSTTHVEWYYGPPSGRSDGRPVPAGRWRATVEVGDREVGAAEVTLDTSAC